MAELLVRQGAVQSLSADDRGGWPPVLQLEPAAKIRKLWQVFTRHRWLIVSMLLALNVVSFIAVHQIRPRYTAESSLIIGSRQAQVLDLKAVLAGLSGDVEAIESEVQLLRSRKVVRQVVQTLKLDQNPDFNPPLPQQSMFAVARNRITDLTLALWTKYAPHRLQALVGEVGAPVVAAEPPPSTRDPLAITTDNVLRRTTIAPKGHSRVVTVSFEAADPVLAANVANELISTYISDQLAVKRDATASAHKWLEDRVAEMREQVINADHAVAAYRQRAGFTRSRTGNLLNEQISTVGEQLMQARNARATAEARVQAAQSGQRVDSMTEATASPTVQSLRAQEATLSAQVAELSRTYGPGHPRLVAARASLGAIEGQIRAELGKTGSSLQQELRAAQSREASLVSTLEGLRRDANGIGDNEVELRALEHEAEANRALYDRLLTRARETNVEGGLQQPDAQVVSMADAPERPSFPNPLVILPIFFVASVIATVLVVFAVDAMDNGFSSLEQVEGALGVRALGVVPRLKRRMMRRHAVHRQSARMQSAFGEAVRNLHTGLMLSGTDQPPKVVLVTSAVPGEGKSSIVLSLARLMASCGKRVVVLDCDLRRPALHKAFGGSAGPGLIDCLSGKALVSDVLQCDTMSPAYLIAAGEPGRNSPDLFASDEMRKLLATLSERFDLVLIDSSPILAVSETRHLCRLADKTLMVVRWQSTRRFAVAIALRRVFEAGGSLAGVLLSVVDLGKFARHSSIGFYQRRIGLYLSE